MASRSVANTGNSIALIMLGLRRHFNTCDECRGALKSHDYGLVCHWAQGQLIAAAKTWETNIAGRLKARRSDDTHVFACPDLSKHSEAYALTAEPLLVTGVQDRIF